MTSRFSIPAMRPSTSPGRHSERPAGFQYRPRRDVSGRIVFRWDDKVWSPPVRQRVVLGHRPAQLPPAVTGAQLAENPWTAPVAVAR